jgi:hypothetical protein
MQDFVTGFGVFSDSLQEVTGIVTRIGHGKMTVFFFCDVFGHSDSAEMTTE